MQAVNHQYAPLSTPAVDQNSTGDDTGLASLLGGIVNDLQGLLEDHLHLMKLEVEDDFQKSKDAVIPMAIGSVLGMTASILFVVMLIGWLSWLVPSIPWFGWSGILALVTAAAAITLMMIAKRKWQRVNPLPEKTLRTVKKTIQSISDQVNPVKP